MSLTLLTSLGVVTWTGDSPAMGVHTYSVHLPTLPTLPYLEAGWWAVGSRDCDGDSCAFLVPTRSGMYIQAVLLYYYYHYYHYYQTEHPLCDGPRTEQHNIPKVV